MAVVRSICDRMAVMELGKIVESGDVYDVFADPHAASTKRFVNASFGLSNLEKLTESGVITMTPDSKLVRLTFNRDSVGEALISEVSRNFKISMNIVLANVEILQDAPLGALIVLVKGDQEDVQKALDHIVSCNVRVEVLHDGMA
jgi:D-methionine transport system ATP-binding protein